MKDNRYLIFEDTERANDRILDIEMNLISKVDAIASAIDAFGIPVTKPMVLIALQKPDTIMETRNKVLAEANAKRREILGDEIFEKMTSGIDTELMSNLCAACAAITDGSYYFKYKGWKITDPRVLDWFDIADDGHAFVPDAIKESIHAELRRYITTSVGKELRDMQINIAAELEKMYHYMRTIDDARKTCLDKGAKGAMMVNFPLLLFEFKETPTGFMQVNPRPINFDPVEREDF